MLWKCCSCLRTVCSVTLKKIGAAFHFRHWSHSSRAQCTQLQNNALTRLLTDSERNFTEDQGHVMCTRYSKEQVRLLREEKLNALRARRQLMRKKVDEHRKLYRLETYCICGSLASEVVALTLSPRSINEWHGRDWNENANCSLRKATGAILASFGRITCKERCEIASPGTEAFFIH